jgi:hypothetical protein
VIVDIDGTVRLGECTPVPCSISSVSHTNDFQPTPAAPDSTLYARVMSKLDGSYSGGDLITYRDDEEEETLPETTASVETTQPAAEQPPAESEEPVNPEGNE